MVELFATYVRPSAERHPAPVHSDGIGCQDSTWNRWLASRVRRKEVGVALVLPEKAYNTSAFAS